ncbi:ribosome biogenesis protein Rrp14-C [Nannizzia gypsea CBS 118893]|uniref:Ribosome biogenesis protein Rrp14-C n=1 Tax=Arthroderma gypseum (strain ATCC MYA-4604 / CBS 118893) TaxID=535722 RepID=E5R108_ARTGP|nr:ribosome biogenesis protein Rrp14-C [Nannizzia gypsea CBS 118893]EFQ97612.1 ribosome biogenesis protein Rrp14-C [Nannizzia gypsea CBS 118893]
MGDSLEERLRGHASAFDGLLSLIPAKYYYGEDNSEQWQRKKQTKEQARDAKRAKLDPETSKSAKDVMDENAKRRKREGAHKDETQSADGSHSEEELLGSEKPREGLKRGDSKLKKPKKATATSNPEDQEAKEGDIKQQAKNEAKAAKQEMLKKKQAEKREKRKEKIAALKAARREQHASVEATSKPSESKDGDTAEQPLPSVQKSSKPKTKNAKESAESDDEMEDISLEGLSSEALQGQPDHESSAPTSPNNASDPSNPPSGSSSASSIVPPTESSTSKPSTTTDIKPSPQLKKPQCTAEQLKERLQKRLDELRAARHADGVNGKPAKNRQELIEGRRQREEARRAQKKEQRQKAKEEEQRLRDEAISKRFAANGPGSLLSSPGSPADSIASIPNNFSFGRVVFADGQQVDSSMTGLRDAAKKRGPQDANTALKAAEAKKARLASLDEEKRADIEEKDMWLNAKKRAHGERVKDDVSLLKKALNRKEGLKKRSEKQWKERIDGVAKGKEIRQSKRDENLRKRKENKGVKGGKKVTKSKGKGRPGFEGGFKSKKK